MDEYCDKWETVSGVTDDLIDVLVIGCSKCSSNSDGDIFSRGVAISKKHNKMLDYLRADWHMSPVNYNGKSSH